MKFKKLFLSESIRILKSPLFFIISGILVAFTLVFCIIGINNDSFDNDNYKIYNISKYSTFEELEQRLNIAKESLTSQQESLNNEMQKNALTKEQIRNRRENIDYLIREINVMQHLFENNIDFDVASQYNAYNPNHGTSNMNHCFVIATILIGLITIMRLAVALPSEIHEGQAKLTLTMPITRTNYILLRFLVILLQSIIMLFFYFIITVILACLIFPIQGSLIFATAKNVFALNVVSSAFLQFSFSLITIISCATIALSFSLLTLNKVAALLISIPICFGDKIIELIESMFSNQNIFSRYFISSNITVQKPFESLYANPIWLSLTILSLYLILLCSISLCKFKKQDIK